MNHYCWFYHQNLSLVSPYWLCLFSLQAQNFSPFDLTTQSVWLHWIWYSIFQNKEIWDVWNEAFPLLWFPFANSKGCLVWFPKTFFDSAFFYCLNFIKPLYSGFKSSLWKILVLFLNTHCTHSSLLLYSISSSSPKYTPHLSKFSCHPI